MTARATSADITAQLADLERQLADTRSEAEQTTADLGAAHLDAGSIGAFDLEERLVRLESRGRGLVAAIGAAKTRLDEAHAHEARQRKSVRVRELYARYAVDLTHRATIADAQAVLANATRRRQSEVDTERIITLYSELLSTGLTLMVDIERASIGPEFRALAVRCRDLSERAGIDDHDRFTENAAASARELVAAS